MVYSVSPTLKRQVKTYVCFELVENALGYLVMLVLSLNVGAFGQFMPAQILWPCVALTVLEALSKLCRGFIHKVYFHSMSCRQVAICQGKSYRFKLGTLQLIEGKLISTFTYVAMIAVVRLLSMVGQVVLTWFLYKYIPLLKRYHDYEEEWGIHRLREFIYATFSCLLLHSFLVFCLIFFSLFYKLFSCSCLDPSAASGIPQPRAGDPSPPSGNPEVRSVGGPFSERLDRFQREMETGITWYVHLHRHFEFGANEAQAHEDKCGLPGYWFYSVEKLLNDVRRHLPYLTDENRRRDERRTEITTGRKLTMALESLFELSRACKACDNCDLLVSNETACYMQDMPRTSRCRHDMDAGLDFAQAEGYVAMLQVLKCSPPDSVDARLAASILAGFAAGLSVLPWQPDRDSEDSKDTDFVVNMLTDDDFIYCTEDSLYLLLDLLEPYALGGFDRAKDEKLRIQEAAASAICSFARAASDVNALVHCPVGKALRARRLPDDHEEMRGYVSRLSYAFTTICPLGWPLDTPWPRGLVEVDQRWVTCVKKVLIKPRSLLILLGCVQQEGSSSIAADCIRTLSWLWTRRLMYWHRHDLRLSCGTQSHPAQGRTNDGTDAPVNDFPPPLHVMADLGGYKELSLQVLRHRTELCLAKTASLSAFSKLHLAKIFISQNLRADDTDVARLLLECLEYWRRALGTRELDWFATEAVESLRDLLHVASAESKRKLELAIAKSPGGVNCVRLMLNPQVSRLRAVRFYADIDKFDESLVHFLSQNTTNCWSMVGNDHPITCSWAAAGLLADLLELRPRSLPGRDVAQQTVNANNLQVARGASPPASPSYTARTASSAANGAAVHAAGPSLSQPDDAQNLPSGSPSHSTQSDTIGDEVIMKLRRLTEEESRLKRIPTRRLRVHGPGDQRGRVPVESILPDDPSQNQDFFVSLFKSLVCTLKEGAIQGPDPQALGSRWDAACFVRIRNCGRTLFTQFILLCWESLGNPAWLPAISLCEDLAAALTTDERMEILEQDLNRLLATRNAIRVIELVLESYPPEAFDDKLVTVFVPPMVALLRKPCAGLHRRLHLDHLEVRCNADIRRGIVAVMNKVVHRIDNLPDDVDRPPNDPINTADLWLPSRASLLETKNEWVTWCRENEADAAAAPEGGNMPGRTPEPYGIQMGPSPPGGSRSGVSGHPGGSRDDTREPPRIRPDNPSEPTGGSAECANEHRRGSPDATIGPRGEPAQASTQGGVGMAAENAQQGVQTGPVHQQDDDELPEIIVA